MSTYRLFPSTDGPSSPVSYTGDFLAGVLFCVTGNYWFEGYWWWVCPTGQSTSPQKFALWQVYGAAEGNVVPGSVVTSGSLTAGQWNYVPLPTPLQLSIGNVPGTGAAVYQAATGFSNSFPDTNSQFGSGDPYASGITSGPLFGYSDQGASAPCPSSAGAFQGAFGVAGTDPSVNMPAQGSRLLELLDRPPGQRPAPTGYSGSYRLWPNYPTVFPTQATIDTQAQTIGTQFSLSEPCTLDNVWFYSPPFAAALRRAPRYGTPPLRPWSAGQTFRHPGQEGWLADGWLILTAKRASCCPPGTTSPPSITAVARCSTWSRGVTSGRSRAMPGPPPTA